MNPYYSLHPAVTLLGLFSIVLYNQGCQASKTSSLAIVISGSMEPAVPGPKTMAECPGCGREFWLVDSSIRREFPVVCNDCGTSAILTDRVRGPELISQCQLSFDSIISRFDIVIFQDPATRIAEMKRVVGLPGERVEIRDGDLWIDRQRVQKTFDEFIRQAILVDSEVKGDPALSRWRSSDSVASGVIPTESMRLPIDWNVQEIAGGGRIVYQNKSLWPKVNTSPGLHPSPILDDYLGNQGDSRSLTTVNDIGLLIVPEIVDRDCQFQIDFFYRGKTIQTELAFVDSQLFVRLFDSSSNPSSRSPLPIIYGVGWITLAILDDALWVATQHQNRCLSQSLSTVTSDFENHVDPTQPIALNCISGSLSLRALHVLRDLHYRGAGGESQTLLADPTSGYTLLGDNIAISNDSRTRWPSGVDRRWIRTRFSEPSDPMTSLRTQIRDFGSRGYKL